MHPALTSKSPLTDTRKPHLRGRCGEGGNPLNSQTFFVDSFSLSGARGAGAAQPVNPW
jgi:hypothetical protein